MAQFIQDKGLSPEEARTHFYGIDRYGLVIENGCKDVRPEQLPYARKEEEVKGWSQSNGEITLLDVVRNAKPTVLIGVSGQTGAFTEQAVREMANGDAARPVIFPLSNPTSRSRKPLLQDLMDWTRKAARSIGTGKPFRASRYRWKEGSHRADQ